MLYNDTGNVKLTCCCNSPPSTLTVSGWEMFLLSLTDTWAVPSFSKNEYVGLPNVTSTTKKFKKNEDNDKSECQEY